MSHETAKNAKKQEKNLQKYLHKLSKTGFTLYIQSKKHLLDALLPQNFLCMIIFPTLSKTKGNITVFTYKGCMDSFSFFQICTNNTVFFYQLATLFVLNVFQDIAICLVDFQLSPRFLSTSSEITGQPLH